MWDVRIYFTQANCRKAWCVHDISTNPWQEGVPFYQIGDAILRIQKEACEEYGLKELGITRIEVLPYPYGS